MQFTSRCIRLSTAPVSRNMDFTKDSGDQMPRAPKDESKQDGAKDGGQDARLHGDMLMNSLLAFLKSSNAYGYELAQRMSSAGLGSFDTGAMYRMLRQLEASGFVSSTWDTGESGPARRVYSLTGAGEAFLN